MFDNIENPRTMKIKERFCFNVAKLQTKVDSFNLIIEKSQINIKGSPLIITQNKPKNLIANIRF